MSTGRAGMWPALVVFCVMLSGCTSMGAATTAMDAPVATPPARVFAPPVGRPGQVALVAMGSTVRGEGLPDGAVALVSAHGPVLEAQGHGVLDSSPGTLTLQVTGGSGTATVSAGDLISRDDSGNLVPLEVVPATLTVGPGERGTLTIRGTWEAGRAYVAWLASGRPVATWTFDVELD